MEQNLKEEVTLQLLFPEWIRQQTILNAESHFKIHGSHEKAH